MISTMQSDSASPPMPPSTTAGEARANLLLIAASSWSWPDLNAKSAGLRPSAERLVVQSELELCIRSNTAEASLPLRAARWRGVTPAGPGRSTCEREGDTIRLCEKHMQKDWKLKCLMSGSPGKRHMRSDAQNYIRRITKDPVLCTAKALRLNSGSYLDQSKLQKAREGPDASMLDANVKERHVSRATRGRQSCWEAAQYCGEQLRQISLGCIIGHPASSIPACRLLSQL